MFLFRFVSFQACFHELFHVLQFHFITEWALLILLVHGGAQVFVAFAVFKSRGEAINRFWLT